MLPSEELLNKYRTAEQNKGGTSEPGAVTPAAGEPENKNTGSSETKPTSQPATGDEGEGQGTTKTQPEGSKGGEHYVSPKENPNDWSRHQKEWEKRFKRQNNAHQAEIAELKKTIAELTAKLPKEPELKPEDFPSKQEWDDYNKRRMADGIKADILEEQRAQKEAEESARKEREEADKKLNAFFKTPERVAQFRETLGNFYAEEREYLDSEEGQLYQEFCDNSPLGLLIAELIAKDPKTVSEMKKWSKDMLLYQLSSFEKGLASKIKAAMESKATPPQPEKKAVPKMPETGPIGGATPSSGQFNAKEWLRKNRPEYYGK